MPYACILSVYYRVLYVSTCYYILVLTATNRGDGILPAYQCPVYIGRNQE